ncbi:MAG: helix-turn-helix domain containing protein [Candidatus Pacebacteria bacterium]|nr:helix-turn-helix domain containing protein [Candidatus Paceibacterota bacterium]
MKSILKAQAIELRKQGLTYREIMARIPIAKSTLSDWLHSVGLSKYQKQRLTAKKWEAIGKGGAAKRAQRIALTEKIAAAAMKDIGTVTRRELWLMGVMLYWAEGSKEKDYRPGSPMRFSNTDPDMIKLFLLWLKEICHKTFDDLVIEVYIHHLHRERTEEIVAFWTSIINDPEGVVARIYYKKRQPQDNQKECRIDISWHVDHICEIKLGP